MRKQYNANTLLDELKNDYKKAREKRDFIAMREIYTELWIRDKKLPFPDKEREEFVFFAGILNGNSVTLPYELSELFRKKCYMSLFEERVHICTDIENSIIEDYLKTECLEFSKIILQRSLRLSPLSLSNLKVKNGDIVRIEVSDGAFGRDLDIYNEADGLRLR